MNQNKLEDEDVATERLRVEGEQDSDDILRISSLTKVFGGAPLSHKVVAVNNVSVGIKPGEVEQNTSIFCYEFYKKYPFQCFGWLGLNGAGKSTTFKILTGQLEPSSGSFRFCQETAATSGSGSIRVGYCPQMDALDKLLTVRETLSVYCKIRGIPSSKIAQVRNSCTVFIENSTNYLFSDD